MRRTETVLTALIFSLALGACTLLTGPENREVRGIIEWVETATSSQSFSAQASVLEAAEDPMDLPVLEAPDTVWAGEPASIVIRTFGANGCWREAGADVAVSGSTASVTPYDREQAASACPQGVVRLPRTVQLTFAEAGEAVLWVTGRRVVVGDEIHEEDGAIIEHLLVVLERE